MKFAACLSSESKYQVISNGVGSLMRRDEYRMRGRELAPFA
jgi:hypothetical protein